MIILLADMQDRAKERGNKRNIDRSYKLTEGFSNEDSGICTTKSRNNCITQETPRRMSLLLSSLPMLVSETEA